MAAWEYRKIDLGTSQLTTNDIELLNAAGEEGWEVVHITDNNVAYLKRSSEKPYPEKRLLSTKS